MLLPHSPVPLTEKFPTPAPHVQVLSVTEVRDVFLRTPEGDVPDGVAIWPMMIDMWEDGEEPFYDGNAHAEAMRAGVTVCTTITPDDEITDKGEFSMWALPAHMPCVACEVEAGCAVMVKLAPVGAR